MFTTLLVFLAVLLLLVIIHELGHFLAAKKVGIRVDEFAFGFKPRIWSKKVGETTYSINSIPLGGYVRLYGEDSNEKGARSLGSKTIAERAFVMVAGAAMNILLGWLILMILFIVGFQPIFPGIEKNPFVNSNPETVLENIAPNSPAEASGMKVGDIFLSVDGQKLGYADVVAYINKHKGQSVFFVVRHKDNIEQIITVVPRENPPPGQGALGVSLGSQGEVKTSVLKAPLAALYESGRMIGLSVAGFGTFISGLVVHQQVSNDVTGLIGIGALTGVARRLGFAYLIQLVMVISIGLGVINLMPILPLDGGHIAALVYEKIKKRPLTEKQLGALSTAGLVFVLMLFVLVTYKDIMRFDILGRLF